MYDSYKESLIHLSQLLRDRYMKFSIELEEIYEYLPENLIKKIDEEKTGIEIDIDKLTEEIEWLSDLEFKEY